MTARLLTCEDMTRRERLGLWLGGDRLDALGAALGSVAAVILTTAPLWGPVMFRG